jgi:Mn-containing catalase
LGINWGAALPIPKTNAERFPEVKKLLTEGLHLKQYTFSADNLSEAGKIYRGQVPASVGRRDRDGPGHGVEPRVLR